MSQLIAAVFVGVTTYVAMLTATDAPDWGCTATACICLTIVVWGPRR